MKGFIEITAIEYVSRFKGDLEMLEAMNNTVLININDISRIQYGLIILKTSYKDGSNSIRFKESYEEIKQLIIAAQ